jgi:CHAT domain-containing protein
MGGEVESTESAADRGRPAEAMHPCGQVDGSCLADRLIDTNRKRGRPDVVRRYALAALAFLGLGGGFVNAWRMSRTSPCTALPSPVRQQLLASIGPFRLVEARLVGFPWAPRERIETRLSDDALVAIRSIENLRRRSTGQTEAADLAVVKALQGRLDDAIRVLSDSVGGEDAFVQSDLAALYIERGVRERCAQDLVRALQAAEQGCALRPSLSEARFNRALALELLGLRWMARIAWRETSWATSDVGWAEEAKSHLRSLDRQRLMAARAIEENALRLAPEAEAVDDVDADALALYRDAVVALRHYEIDHATALLERIRVPLAGKSLDPWWHFQHAVASYQSNHPDEARDELAKVLKSARATLDHRLAGRAKWMLGLCDALAGKLEGANRLFRSAGEDLHRTTDVSGVAAVRSFSASTSAQLGDTSTAWRLLVESLRDERLDLRRRSGIATDGAALALETVGPESAAAFGAEAVHCALLSRDPVFEAMSLGEEGALLARLGHADEARHRLLRATAATQRGTNGSVQRALDGWIALLRGALLTPGDPKQADRLFSKSLAELATQHNRFPLAAALHERARLRRGLGNLSGAEADLHQALREVETTRNYLMSDSVRRSFLDAALPVYDEMVSLQLEMRHPAAALAYNEASRARVLKEHLTPLSGSSSGGGADRGSFRLETLQGALRERTLVEYRLAEDRLIVWIVTAENIRVTTIPISARALGAKVRDFRECLHRGEDAELRRRGRDLYQLLIAPALPADRSLKSIVVAPDGALWELPFAALVDPFTGQWLIEQTDLALVHSATLVSRPSRWGIDGASPRTLIVTSGSHSVGTLPRLAATSFERATVEASMPRHAWIDGDSREAKRRFLDSADEYSIVHFSGHAVSDRGHPAFARLILGDATSDQSLYSWELEGKRFCHINLIVLSGCSTAGEGLAGQEGLDSLAHSFLQAGVRQVVASIMPADDRAAAALFSVFYRSLHRGLRPEESLREASVRLLRSSDVVLRTPRSWAAFEVFLGFDQQSP